MPHHRAVNRDRQRFRHRPWFDILESRLSPAVTTFAANAQHTSLSAVASQPLQAVHWQTPVDNYPTSRAEHYGGPLITDANTVIYPYRTGQTTADFHILGRNGNDGSLVWDTTTDWVPKDYNWYPALQPVLTPVTNRVYFAGRGGTVYYRSNPDSPTGTVTQIAFFGTLADYTNNKTAYDSFLHVDTPLTADSQGNIFFGFRVTGTVPGGLVSGIARISSAGVGTWVSAETAANGDVLIDQAARNSTMALSNDESTLYLGVRRVNDAYYGKLVGLNSTTLATQYVSDILRDPRNNQHAGITSDSTASPMIAPDGQVFYGVMGNPSNGSRGWMLQFSPNLATQGIPGGFGWDTTPALVPASMVPQYTGSSSYLIFTKYNNYYGIPDGGDGSNGIAVLDPNDTEPEYHPSSNGLPVMKRIVYKVGPTPDWDYPSVPTAVREWCINYGMVDPATFSIMVNCADGKFYRWYLPTNTLSETLQLTNGIGQPYTMTVIGVDGTTYGIQIGTLFAMGRTPQLSISDPTIVEGNSGAATATFTVTLDFPRTQPITVNYATADGSAKAGSDYTATSGTLTFNPGDKSKTITVSVASDALNEIDESFFVDLSNPSKATILDGQGQATITNDDPLPTMAIGDAAINEGNAGTALLQFTVSLSAASGQTITVNYASADDTALEPVDYQAKSGSLTFLPGELTQTISIQINGDTAFENTEAFSINLTSVVNATLIDNQAQGTITNDDGVPSLSIDDVIVGEGGIATFTVTLSSSSIQTITVDYATAPNTATTSDYAHVSDTLTFMPGQLSKTLTVNTTDDALNELTESFFVNLTNPTNAFAADSQGQGSITDNDPEPSLSIADLSINEGVNGTTAFVFTVSLSALSGRTVTVGYSTADGTATIANNDYQMANGTVTFNAGELSKTITVLANGDMVNEPDESFLVNLSSPDGATIADGTATGTILNDDALIISINDVAIAEGNTGSATATLTVTMSSVGTQPVTVNWATANGTAIAPGDYLSGSGTVTFNPGETSKPIEVIINGDVTNEANETLIVLLSNAVGGTISDDQGQVTISNDDAVPSITITDVSVPEGDYNDASINLYVTLSAASGQTITVDFETANGTASSTSVLKDYIDTLGTLTFLPGETIKSFPVTIKGDTIDELNETFYSTLLNPVNATLAVNKQTTTIIDDDVAYVIINNVSVTEGDAGTKAVTLTVNLTLPSDRVVTVDFNTEDDTAVAGSDYVASNGTVSFAAHDTERTITVNVMGDLIDELAETFDVELSNATNGAYISTYEGIVTINDNDAPARVSNVVINNGDAQRSRVTTVRVEFDQLVNLPTDPATAFELRRQSDNAPVTMSAVVVNGMTTSVTLTFFGGAVNGTSLADGRYTLRAFSDLITNAIGKLDGDNDGTGGDNFVFASAATGSPPTNIFRIFGDATGDGFVAANDFIVFRQHFNGVADMFDFDGDGSVSASDFMQFRMRFNGSI